MVSFTFVSCQAQSEKTLLWEISGQGLEKPSYLYGTIHIICEDDVNMTEAMKNAFGNTEQLVLEINLSDTEAVTKAATKMINMEGYDYKGQMSEAGYNKLDSLMTANMGMGMSTGRIMKPLALMSVAYMGLVSCSTTSSMEEEFQKMMEDQGKSMQGLETIESQIAIFDDIPIEEQITWLDEMMVDGGEGREDFESMMTLYKAQDIEAMYNSFDEYQEYAKYSDALLKNRNTAWIPVMSEMMKDKSTFFAVGAMHLGGDIGVINLLREAGYTVKAVSNN